MVIIIAWQLFSFVYYFELQVEVVASKSCSESGVTQANMGGNGTGHGGLGTISPKGQSRRAISMGKEGWLALFQRETIMALKIWYRLASFTITWLKGRKLFKKLLPYSGKNSGHGKQLLLGRGLGICPGMGAGTSGAGAISLSSREGSCGGWEAAAICRLYEK